MKKVSYLIITLLIFISFKSIALAGSLSMWSSVQSARVGDMITISVSASRLAGQFSITSSNNSVLSGGESSVWLDDDTKSFTFKAVSTGSATITVKALNASDYDNESAFNGSKALTVNVINVTSNNSGGSSGGSSNSNRGTTGSKKTYSTNNNLKSLEVEGFKLTPDFSKDKLEYILEVPNETAKVNIKATPEDDKASVKGTGEVKVTEGKNKLEVKVIAENGNEKVYIINLTVKELDPIEVKVGNKKLTIVRKDESLTPPDNYEKSTIKIGKDEVLCFRNNVTKNIIIALKDDKGKIEFYSYDQKKNTYTLYNGHKIGNISLNILDMPKDKIPLGYLKTSFTYDKSKITGYQYVEDGVTYAADSSVKGNDFYLIYAVNEATGKKGLYMYDKLENTIQRYNSNLFLTYQNKADSYFLYFLISLLVLAISIVTFTIILIKKKKHKTKFA